MPRRRFLYGRHFVRRYVSATVALGGAGKSSLILAELVAMTSGKALLGIEPPEQLRGWYWNGEDPTDEIDRRIEAICLHFNIDPRSLGGRLYRNSGRDTELIIAKQTRSGGFSLATPVIKDLIKTLRDSAIDILIIDPLVSAHRVPENDNTAMDAVAKAFAQVAEQTDCAIELVHHVRKPGAGAAGITSMDGRGASALGYAVRSGRVINTMTEAEAELAGVGDRRRYYFRADVDKANIAPPATKATWFQLISVGLGNGSGGLIDDQDYVGVVEPWTWPDAFAGVTVSDLRRIQTVVFQSGPWRADPRAKQWVGYAVAQTLRLDASNKHHRARIRTMLQQWMKNEMFIAVEGEDEQRHKATYVEVGKWAND